MFIPTKLGIILLLVPTIFILAIPRAIPLSNAQTSQSSGTVCITAPSFGTGCPSTPSSLFGLSGTSGTIAVNLALLNATTPPSVYNAFNIMVKADPSILNATSFDLSNTALTSPVVDVACINGKHLLGAFGCSPQDGPGVAHLEAAAGCAGVTLACGMSVGNLFNINYNILASTLDTVVGFQNGCTDTSNSTNCVTIQFVPADILCCPPPNPENLETAGFSTSPTTSFDPFNAIVSFQGITATVYGDLFIDQSLGTLSGTVSINANNGTTGVQIYVNSFKLSLKIFSNNEIFILAVPTSPEPRAVTCRVSVSLGSTTCYMSKNPDLNHRGIVDLVDVSVVFRDFGANSGSSMYYAPADLNGDGQINVIDAAIMADDFLAPVLG